MDLEKKDEAIQTWQQLVPDKISPRASPVPANHLSPPTEDAPSLCYSDEACMLMAPNRPDPATELLSTAWKVINNYTSAVSDKEQLQEQLNSLQGELRKARAEKNDATHANKNLAKENELLSIQVHREKLKHDKQRSTLGEEIAELREDTRELAAENTELRRDMDLLRSNVRVENAQAPIVVRLKAEAQLRSAELDRLRGVESQLKLETERHAAALYRLREMEGNFNSLLADVNCEKENQKRQTDQLAGQRKLYEEKIDELRRDRAVMGQVVQSRVEDESKLLARIAQLTKENENQQRHIQGLLQNQKRFEVEEAKLARLARGGYSSEIHIQSRTDENATLRTKVQDLEKDRKDKEPLTRIGASIRIAILGSPDSADDSGNNVVADAAVYKAGFLSPGWEGCHFRKYYHCPVFVNLDYAAMPKYCMMLKLLAGVNGIESQHEFPRLASEPEWAEREQTDVDLQKVWNEVATSDVMQFEARKDVDLMLDKLDELNHWVGRWMAMA